jgi:hypothetical protein
MVLESKISQVANHESQKVSSFSILGTSPETLMFFGQIINDFLLIFDFKFCSFKQDCAQTHFVGIEFHDLGNKIFFGLVDYFMELIFLLCF